MTADQPAGTEVADDLAARDEAIRAYIEQLVAVADSIVASPGANRNRVACWIARSALEALVLRMLALRGLRAGRSTMRSQLTCLEVAVPEPPGLATNVEYTWSRLSNACHHHAYQLDPSLAEVRSLLDNVRAIQAAADRLART